MQEVLVPRGSSRSHTTSPISPVPISFELRESRLQPLFGSRLLSMNVEAPKRLETLEVLQPSFTPERSKEATNALLGTMGKYLGFWLGRLSEKGYPDSSPLLSSSSPPVTSTTTLFNLPSRR
ncbi:hypothetical protein L6452_20818 [Arctium lappa]|uniref:Uncharacterized protein n=1 Tax=Arctium lappa TaxID=4217 RepID=A0ACB9BBY7_ARCLA|nr:hypothetical protein L6452_20818 [Arctium lappa]